MYAGCVTCCSLVSHGEYRNTTLGFKNIAKCWVDVSAEKIQISESTKTELEPNGCFDVQLRGVTDIKVRSVLKVKICLTATDRNRECNWNLSLKGGPDRTRRGAATHGNYIKISFSPRGDVTPRPSPPPVWTHSLKSVCYHYYYYYYKICIAHKFKHARVGGAGVTGWENGLAGKGCHA